MYLALHENLTRLHLFLHPKLSCTYYLVGFISSRISTSKALAISFNCAIDGWLLLRHELLGLQWKDINFTRNTMSISKQITARSGTIKNFHFCVPKTKSSIRTIPFGKVLRKSFEMCKIEASKVNGFTDEYFVCGDAFPLSPNALSDHKKALAEKAGVKVIRTHDFRHSCASLLIDRGSNVTLVAKYLGHTKIEETLNTYSHMYNSTLNDIVNKFDDLDK